MTQPPRSKSPTQPYDRPWRQVCLLVGLFLAAIALVVVLQGGGSLLPAPIIQFTYGIGVRYQAWMEQQTLSPIAFLGLSFLGGLLASISPCILSLLPVNLGYIGTLTISSRQEALVRSGLFVLGVTTVLSVLGLVAALAGAIWIQYRGYIAIGVGLLIVIMGLNLWGLIRLSLPQLHPNLSGLGTYGVGMTFALVSSPCTSPILVAVLAVGTITGSPLWGALALVSYSLGYTAIIFLASVFTGLVKQTKRMLPYAERFTQLAGMVLVLVGFYYLVDGSLWLIAILV